VELGEHRGLPAFAALMLLACACSMGSSPSPDGGPLDGGLPAPSDALSLSTNAIDFGTVADGLSRTRNVVVTNRSDVDLSMKITPGPSGQTALTLSPSGIVRLAARQALTVVARFTPPAGCDESYQETFDLSSCATGCSRRLDLTGVAASACLTVDPTGVDFGFAPGEKGVAILNRCDQPYPLVGSPLLSAESGGFRLAPGAPGDHAMVPAGGELWVGVVFAPNNAQLYDGFLTLGVADPDERQVVVHLTGFGGGGPKARCTPLSLDSGPNAVGIPSSLSLRCTNVGADVFGHPETELFILPHSDNPSFVACVLDPQTGTCVLPDGGGIRPEETAFVDVSYAPTGPGTDRAQLTLFTDGTDPQPIVTLSGSAEAIAPCDGRLADPLLEFGTVPPGQTTLLSFSMTNLGQVDCLVDGLRIVPDVVAAAAGDSPPFSLAQDVTWHRLAPGEQFKVQVEFTPPASSESGKYFQGEAELSVSNPNAPHWVVTLSGTAG